MNIDPLLLLAEDRELITYRKSLNKLTGSVTSTILVQQILFWSKKKNHQPFYKFKAPCSHEKYKEGDSWTEELGFGLSEFDTALKKIGTKITKGTSKELAFKGKTAQHLVIYWTDSSRVTWYHLNVNLLRYLVNSIYLDTTDSQVTYEDEKSNLPLSRDYQKSPEEKGDSDFLEDIVTHNGKTSEATAPNPDDQWFNYSDKFIKIFHHKTKRYPNEDEKELISEYAATGGVTPEQWEQALSECNLHYTGQRVPVPRVIEVCRAGGTYETFKAQKWPDDTKQTGSVTRAKDGGYYV